jgi:molecular chaperone DnaK (HSP70)
VNSHSYRLACKRKGKSFAHPMIPRNCALPHENTITIPVMRCGIDTIHVNIFEGESDDAKLCYHIGRVRIDGLPKDTTKRWLVSLSLKCQEDGKISVSAVVRDPANPKIILRHAQAALESQHGMNTEQVIEAQHFVNSLEMG